MPDDSVVDMWRSFLRQHDETPSNTRKTFTSWHFCDNEADANECLDLVLRGVKRATSPALPWLEDEGLPVPRPGDLSVVTDWDGVAHCIIRTTRADLVPLGEIPASHAAAEGEGDGSLTDWYRIHRPFYQREAENRPYDVTDDMLIVCERFEVVFSRDDF